MKILRLKWLFTTFLIGIFLVLVFELISVKKIFKKLNTQTTVNITTVKKGIILVIFKYILQENKSL
jgi:hypothetical protein